MKFISCHGFAPSLQNIKMAPGTWLNQAASNAANAKWRGARSSTTSLTTATERVGRDACLFMRATAPFATLVDTLFGCPESPNSPQISGLLLPAATGLTAAVQRGLSGTVHLGASSCAYGYARGTGTKRDAALTFARTFAERTEKDVGANVGAALSGLMWGMTQLCYGAAGLLKGCPTLVACILGATIGLVHGGLAIAYQAYVKVRRAQTASVKAHNLRAAQAEYQAATIACEQAMQCLNRYLEHSSPPPDKFMMAQLELRGTKSRLVAATHRLKKLRRAGNGEARRARFAGSQQAQLKSR